MTASWTPGDGREPRTGELPVITPGSAAPTAEVHTRLHSRGQRLGDRLPPLDGLDPVPAHRPLLDACCSASPRCVVGRHLRRARATRSTNQTRSAPSTSSTPAAEIVVRGQRPAQIVHRAGANERALETLRAYSLQRAARPLLRQPRRRAGWSRAGAAAHRPHHRRGRARSRPPTCPGASTSAGPTTSSSELADTFDDMLGRIDDAFESQRQFIHEASHELRNPLAVIRTNLDVALVRPRRLGRRPAPHRRGRRALHRADGPPGRRPARLRPQGHRSRWSASRSTSAASSPTRPPSSRRRPRPPASPSSARRPTGPVGRRRPRRAAPGAGQPAGQRRAPRPGGHRASGCGPAARGPGSGWPSRTRARASPPRTRTGCSSGSGGATPPRAGPRAAAASGSRSCARSPRPTAARCKLASEPGHGATFAIWLPALPAPVPAEPEPGRPVLRPGEAGDPVSGVPGVLSSRFRVAAVPCAPRSGHRRAHPPPTASPPRRPSTDPGARPPMSWDHEPPTTPPQSGEPTSPFSPPDDPRPRSSRPRSTRSRHRPSRPPARSGRPRPPRCRRPRRRSRRRRPRSPRRRRPRRPPLRRLGARPVRPVGRTGPARGPGAARRWPPPPAARLGRCPDPAAAPASVRRAASRPGAEGPRRRRRRGRAVRHRLRRALGPRRRRHDGRAGRLPGRRSRRSPSTPAPSRSPRWPRSSARRSCRSRPTTASARASSTTPAA